eukprot:TRINITY_DN536_c0_g1_i1.p1 TRINITY_DN536_c0_g1~~TRINITY_DN536_c0_g1_i1.p1  ORF type:complete len:512 (-),score=34.41 TRINITY_DN536_c0_g1_i1:663-2198(-)
MDQEPRAEHASETSLLLEKKKTFVSKEQQNQLELPRSSFRDKLESIFKHHLSGKNLVLLVYMLLLIFSGTTNRVTFKLMQYSLINYSYFVSQFTTFVFIPINFTVIFAKQAFTNQITPEMTSFPKYKFAVIGLLDSLAGLLLVVGGVQVPGMMQNLLIQGAVPMTMICSIIFLRNLGCTKCCSVRQVLLVSSREKKWKRFLAYFFKISFRGRFEEKALNTEGSPRECSSFVVAAGDTFSAAEVLRLETEGRFDEIIERARASGQPIVFHSESTPWKAHLKSYYSIIQYLGATIIMSGLLVTCIGGSQSGSSVGPIFWDLVFFSATIPLALSGVYKEIAFAEVNDMDVWYLNGWVALFQFLIGILYAPLAAVMNQPPLSVSEIPKNLFEGFMCFVAGHNYITTQDTNCSILEGCSETLCCDSCSGDYSCVSDASALLATSIYLVANLAYNLFLLLVIKYGSAALMYISSTVVLPLGAICFTFKFIMGCNSQQFNLYTGIGLGLVLFGLITFR